MRGVTFPSRGLPPGLGRRGLALSALGVGAAALVSGLWLLRAPIAEAAIRQALHQRGVEADLKVQSFEFSGLILSNVRLGPRAAPEAEIPAARIGLAWRGFAPRLDAVELAQPRLKLTLSEHGQLGVGSLARLSAGGGNGARALPRIAIELTEGVLALDSPFGQLTAAVSARGRIGEDFVAAARLDPAPAGAEQASAYILSNAVAALEIAAGASEAGGARANFNLQAARIRWRGVDARALTLNANGALAPDLASFQASGEWTLAGLGLGDEVSAADLAGSAQTSGALDGAWTANLMAAAASIGASDDINLRGTRLAATLAQDAGAWRLDAERAQGFGLISQTPSAEGALVLGRALALNGAIRLQDARLSPQARRDLASALPVISAAPIGPTFAATRTALDRAAEAFDLTVPFQLAAADGGARLTIEEPIALRARSGAVIEVTPIRADAPALSVAWPGPRLHGGVAADLAGGALPPASLLFDQIDWAPGAPLEAIGTLALATFSAGDAQLAAREIAVALTVPPAGGGRIDLVGPALMSGPFLGGAARDMEVGLDVQIAWGDGWRVNARDRACQSVRVRDLDVAGLSFQNGALRLCPEPSGVFVAADAREHMSGGFSLNDISLNGVLSGKNAAPARLRIAQAHGAFNGAQENMRLDLRAERPALEIAFADTRTLRLTGARILAAARITDTWAIAGTFQDGALEDQSLPGAVSAIAGRWSAAPDPQAQDGAALIRVEAGEARIDAHVGQDNRPLFNPLRLADASAVMRQGAIQAQAALLLDIDARRLAEVRADHAIDTGVGEARIETGPLAFDQTLQPYHLTELARGLVENVRGPASASALVTWNADTFTATGVFRPRGLSFATRTIPIVEDVSGDIQFDDLFALTTPPGQSVTVGLVNPGVAVRDGRLRFQLRDQGVVEIEQAEFQFASGVLAVAPTDITLGAEETRLELTLRDVDVAALIAQLNVPDLTATGTVGGSFPLLLNRRTAIIKGGVLRASAEGGEIAYTGSAGEAVEGPARMAFQALTAFHYDRLALTLDGDLSGELVSSVQFSGENTSRSVELASGAPGLGDVRVRGVPFAFNVTVTAPFRRLADTAAGFSDARGLVDRAVSREPEGDAEPGDAEPGQPPEPVDPKAPAPR